MKIGLDVSSLTYQRGVSRYTGDLVKALAKEQNAELFLYGTSLRQQKLLKAELRKVLRSVTPDRYDLKLQYFPPSLLAKVWSLGLNPIKKQFPQIDVFHSWDWLQPPDKDLPLVSTIHDLAIIRFPEVAHPKVLKMHQDSWQILRERKAQIIAVSEATKSDILRYLEIPSQQVTVVHEALPTQIGEIGQKLNDNPDLVLTIKKRLNLNKPYLLFVGTREPRKNLARLIQAWLPLAKDYQLIIAGEQSWDGSEQISKNPNLRFMGRVSDSELAVLYHNAELFVYPSLYEGFGLPVLEAFAYGVPVVSSDIPAIREVAGNAAELANPLDEASIRQSMEKILNEKKTDSENRIKKMIIRLQLFNWQKTARQTMSVYQRAIDNFGN
ncbi:glycosyltransferase family 4 protein [Patescibacteria group bacterium]|nr:glycosyltransferase family 4 protein [Patescibacteria group bacterium]